MTYPHRDSEGKLIPFQDLVKTLSDGQLNHAYAIAAFIDWWKADEICLERDRRRSLITEPICAVCDKPKSLCSYPEMFKPELTS